MSGWVCQWKPFWIPVGESFQKTYLEEWKYTSDDSSDEEGFATFPALVQSPANHGYFSKTKLRDDAPPTPRPAEQPDALPWEPAGGQDKAYFWERNEAPLPPLRPKCNFIHPWQLNPFPEHLELPFSSDEILSGYEDIVSSGTLMYRLGQNGPSRYLGTFFGGCPKTTADFREASRRRHDASSQTIRFSKNLTNRSPVAAKYLQLEPRTPTWKRRCLRKADCKQVARSLPCRKLLGMSTTSFSRIAST